MAIEIETKGNSKSSPFINILFYLSIILLIGAAGSFFTLNHLKDKTKEDIKNTEKEIKKITEGEMENLENKIKLIEAKTSNFAKIVKSKKTASDVIPFLEEICHPKVYFSSVTTEEENKIIIDGVAESYKDLEQQLVILRDEEKVNNFSLEKIENEKEGGINFNINIYASSDLFYEKK
ncbi:MAG: PilN domain-containing protein [Minisyncoccales bacterium]